MKVTITKTISEDVFLNNQTVNEVVRNKLFQMLDSGTFIKKINGKDILCCWEDTGHGSGLDISIREATDLDKALLKVLGCLK